MVWISYTFLTSRAGYKTMGNFSNGFPVYTARAIAVIGGSYWLYVFPCCNVDLKEEIFPNHGGLLGLYSCWHHQMDAFSTLLAICAGNSPVTGEFPAQRPVTRSFDVFIDLRLNKRLSKQSWGWWFEAPSGSLWRYCNFTKRTEVLPTWSRAV